MSAAAAKVLEAVLVPDTLQTEEMHTFKDNEGRNYSYMFNFEQVCYKINYYGPIGFYLFKL